MQETQIVVILVTSLITQWPKSSSIEEFVGRVLIWSKMCVLISAYLCEYRVAGWYAVIFIGKYMVEDCVGSVEYVWFCLVSVDQTCCSFSSDANSNMMRTLIRTTAM